jgi:hypothetical protein
VLTVLNIGLVAVSVAILLSFVVQATALTNHTPAWLIPIAVVALGLGGPHGAVDHLTFTQTLSSRQFVKVGLVYLAIAILGTLAILRAPGPAFVMVLAMTV